MNGIKEKLKEKKMTLELSQYEIVLIKSSLISEIIELEKHFSERIETIKELKELVNKIEKQ